MKPFILVVIGKKVSLLFLYKDAFGIKLLTKVDMPLNNVPNQTNQVPSTFVRI